MTDGASDPYVGKTLDRRYHVRRLIGRGGMGAVYEADHVGLGRRVAIKFLLESSPDLIARFQREARAASKVTHDHVVQIFDVGTDDSGVDFIVMELVEGRDLRQVLQAGAMPLPRALHVANQLLAGLHAIHEGGIVHRDIKPANILLTERDGDPDYVKIMDFGISKAVDTDSPTITQTGHVVGTPLYMSPEQLAGHDADRRSDLYAAGLVLYEMLAGAPPFTGSTVQLAGLHLAAQPRRIDELVDSVPDDIVRAIDRALAKSPGDRYADALQMIEALGGEVAERSTATTGPRATVAARPSAREITGAATVRDKPAAAEPDPQATVREKPAPTPAAAMKAKRPASAGATRRTPTAVYVLAALLVVGVPIGVYLGMRSPTRDASQVAATTHDAALPADAAAVALTDDAAIAVDAAVLAVLGDVVVDAAVEAAPHVVTPVRRRPRERCRCVTAYGPVCSVRYATMCTCKGMGKTLCTEPKKPGQSCNPVMADPIDAGRVCRGYFERIEARGLFMCEKCPGLQTYRGRKGDACTGYDRLGREKPGVLGDCDPD